MTERSAGFERQRLETLVGERVGWYCSSWRVNSPKRAGHGNVKTLSRNLFFFFFSRGLSSEEEQKEEEGAAGRGAVETSWEFGSCVMVGHLGSLKSFHSLKRK